MMLAKKGAQVNKKNQSSGNTPLHVAALNGHAGCVNALLLLDGDKTVKNKQVLI